MLFIRRALLSLVTTLAMILLFTTVIDLGVIRVAGSASKIKHLISQSGIYKDIVPGALSQAKQQSLTGAQVSLTDPLVQSAAEQAFSPQLLQADVNQVIDATYDWLNGKTATPQFKLDLSGAKADFADKIATAASNRAASLPVCKTATDANPAEPLAITCLPRGVPPNLVGAEARTAILSGQGFLDKPVLTASDIKNNNSNKSVFDDQLKNAPRTYRMIKATPIILAVLSLLALVAMVFLSSSRRHGIQLVGAILIAVGILLMVIGLVMNKLVTSKLLPQLQVNPAIIQTDVRNIVRDAVHSIDRTYIVAGAGYLAAGAGLIGLTYWRRDNVPVTTAAEPIPDTPAGTPPKTKSKKSPKK